MRQKLNIQQICSIFYEAFYQLFPPLCFFLLVKTSFTLNVVVLQSMIMFSEKCSDKRKFVGILKKIQIL